MKICLVVADFYKNISNNLIKGAVKALKKKGIKNYKIIKVPGAFEIPIVISILSKEYDAFIALGCIIKGQTPHFNFLSSSVTNSLINLSTKYELPIGNGVLTCNKKKQAIKRSDPKKLNKGGEAATAVLTVLKLIK